MNIGILEPGGFSEAAKDKLASLGKLALYQGQSLRAFLQELDVLFIRLGHTINKEFLEQAPRLKILCSPTTGHGHIDEEALTEKGILLISLKLNTDRLRNVKATPEHTFGLIIALLRNYADVIRHIDHGIWDRNLHIGEELAGKTVGIIGMGRVGQILAGYCEAFDARVVYFDLKTKDITSNYTQMPSVSELINASDVLALCASEQPDQLKVLNRELLTQCEQKYFVNTARGELVDEDHLLRMAVAGRFKGVALDVIENELDLNRLDVWRAAAKDHNIIITPHIGGATRESMAKTEILIVELLQKQLRG